MLEYFYTPLLLIYLARMYKIPITLSVENTLNNKLIAYQPNEALQGNIRHYYTFQLMNCVADLRYYGTDCIQISHCKRLIRTN